MDKKDLDVIKSLMTHIHIILGGEPEKNFTFGSVEELYNEILLSLGPLDNINKNYYSTELLDYFDDGIEWMRKKGIIILEKNGKGDRSCTVRIDKPKLVKYIVDPESMIKVDPHTKNQTI